jgi:hypothetical protein
MLLVFWNYAEDFVIPTVCLRNKAEIINIRDKNNKDDGNSSNNKLLHNVDS